jgi:asparagine synthase (glutamine-hydrolysing)
MNEFVGIWNVADPAGALRRRFGVEPSWSDGTVAFGGASVWQDLATGMVVSGEYVPDNAARGLSPAAALSLLVAGRGGDAPGGMFGVAVWDTRARVLTLVRDPVGARTLYYAQDTSDGSCWFAARLRTLRRAAPCVTDALSLPALRDYLTCAYVPGARTLWRDISELRPGAFLRLPGGATETYWTPRETDAGGDLEENAARLRPLLEDAVSRRLPPEGEPVGVFLSGGLDSSLVTALAAARQHAGGGRNVHTFAIHFGPNYPNELTFSQMVADHCRTRHRVLELSARQIQRHLGETIRALDDPIGDPLTVPNLLLGRAAAQEVGVTLNGEGGDPCFGGPKNLPMLLHELYGDGTEEDRVAAYFRSYQKCYADLPRLLTPEAQAALKDAPPQAAILDEFLGTDAPMRQYLNRLMQINVNLKGADQILTKVSNLTTACGLSGLSPLFDPQIVEAGFAIPPTFKLAGSEEKAVLKAAVRDLLPAPILRRPKSGMLVPVQHWFRRDLRRFAAGMLLSRGARIRPYIRQEVVREWLAYRRTTPFVREGVKLWLLLTLEIWLRENE